MRGGSWGIGQALATAAAWLAVAPAAGAQQAPVAPSVDTDEIIVTGEKSQRSLQDTAASVAVTTAETIREENILDLYDVINRTPNVSETYGPTGFTIRGISDSGVSGGGAGGLATVYVDGVALSKDSLFSGPLNMWDVGQVEILRGPQSTLQGRNALAGAIIVRTNEPTMEWDARARVVATDADELNLAAAFGGPIVADQLAFRVALENRTGDGFIYNPTRQEDANPVDATSVRGRLLFTPTALPKLKVLATYTHTDFESGYLFTYARTDVPNYFENRVDTSNDINDTKNTGDFATLEASYDLTDSLSVTSVTAYGRSDDVTRYDGDLSPVPEAFGTTWEDSKAFTQELRLNYEGARLSGLTGLYYSKREIDASSRSRTAVETPESTLVGVLQSPLFGLDAATAQFAASAYVAALPVILVDYQSLAPSEIETMALFGDARFKLTDRLTLLGGFRYDREEYTITSDQVTTFAGTYPNPALYGPLAPVIGGLNLVVDSFVSQASASAPKSTRTFEAFLPKAGVTYDWTDDLSTSFVVQRGYRSGGSQINIARSTVVPYDPEFTWNYELSLRSEWLDGRLVANANLYYIDWTDQQVNVFLGLNAFDYQTENAGKSHLYGAEFSIAHKPTENFDWYASAGYSKTEFDDFVLSTGGASNDLSGSEFAYAPAWTLAIGGTQRWSNGLMLNLNANYRDAAFADTGVNQSIYAIGSRTLVNGKFGYERDRWGAFLFVSNLLDEEYTQYPRITDNQSLLGDPRVIGITLETDW